MAKRTTDASRVARSGLLASPRLLRIGVWAHQEDQWGRSLVAGVFRYSNLHGSCEIQLLQEHLEAGDTSFLNDWRPDGLILGCELPAQERGEVAEFPCPSVLVNLPLTSVRGPIVAQFTLDDKALAREVADRFRRRGFAHFAYLGFHKSIPDNYSERRQHSFIDCLREYGLDCDVFDKAGPSNWGDMEPLLVNWLRNLPKPCAIMVCNDRHGRRLLDACRIAGVKCPEQVSVIGVDNDILLCETSTPPLSSVQPDNEGAGYRAAEILCEALVSGRIPTGNPPVYSYGVKDFVERASSQDYKGAARLVAAARTYIARHACEGIRVKDVAEALNVSVRLLQLRFAEVGGLSVREELERVRFKRVCELLRDSKMRIGDIAPACGFVSETNLRSRFLRLHGCTMREYRRQANGVGN